MRFSSWLGKFWKRLSTGVVQDVPAHLDECEDCREIDCTQERWESCERRLATEAAEAQGRLGESTPKSIPAAPDKATEVSASTDLARTPKPAPS